MYILPGGGITLMIDVEKMPANSFGSVPTPAVVAPIEFSMDRETYVALGGHTAEVQTFEQLLAAKRPALTAAPWGYRLRPAID